MFSCWEWNDLDFCKKFHKYLALAYWYKFSRGTGLGCCGVCGHRSQCDVHRLLERRNSSSWSRWRPSPWRHWCSWRVETSASTSLRRTSPSHSSCSARRLFWELRTDRHLSTYAINQSIYRSVNRSSYFYAAWPIMKVSEWVGFNVPPDTV